MSGYCPPPPQPVPFSYTMWAARYPELAAYVNQDLATIYWSEAGIYLDNTGCGLISDTSVGGRLNMILNMITAHIAFLNTPTPGPGGTSIPATPLVGRISQATEGSVSVTVDMGTTSNTAAWLQSTKYGAAAWYALAPYRTARYYPGPRPYLGVGGLYGIRGWNW